jgi:hypothetical protein
MVLSRCGETFVVSRAYKPTCSRIQRLTLLKCSAQLLIQPDTFVNLWLIFANTTPFPPFWLMFGEDMIFHGIVMATAGSCDHAAGFSA